MDSVLIQSAQLVLPGHEHHNQQVDVLVENGVIKDIGQNARHVSENIETVDAKGHYLAPGFFDLNVNFGEPGLETKESVLSGCRCAAAGGFTGVAVHPNTQPAIQSRAEVSLVTRIAHGNLVDAYPIGAVSRNRDGIEMTEMYDMHTHGAIAFSDGDRSIQQAGLMSRALLYSHGFNGKVISFAQDDSIAEGNMMNEGVMSTYLGMKGNPNLSEAMMVARDLFLAEYNDTSIHFTTISTKESVELIKQAKKKGIRVTCDVAVHHLVYTDDDIRDFDSHFKVSPPLRTKGDQTALIEGLEDGTIDNVVSQHTPHEVEFKNVEFQIARFGISGLQTLIPQLLKTGLSIETIVEKMSINPRKILNLELPSFNVGDVANIVLIDPDRKWVFNDTTNKSKSKNSPLFGHELTGKAILVINNKQIMVNY